jgi:FKBP-type peptidyl-prolyl cis-trans isomerase
MRLLALLVLIAACADPEPPAPPREVDPHAGWEHGPDGLRYKVVHPGKPGAHPTPGQYAKVHFRGTLPNGRVIEDTLKRGQPFEFMVGAGQMIVGWDVGVPLMTVGARYRFFVPWTIGYGVQGSKNVPGKTDLYYDIELLEVRDGVRIPPFPEAIPDRQRNTPSGLVYEVIREGDGPLCAPGKAYKVRFALWNRLGHLVSCTETQNRYLVGEPSELRFGPRPEPFFAEALPLMKQGGVYRLDVPPELCWGAFAAHPRLPPNSATVWELEVVESRELPEFRKPDPERARRTDSGLVYEFIEPGEGRQPGPESRVKADYTGWLADGTRFDSSRSRFAPAVFPVPVLVSGWQEGLQLMREGGTALFEIPPELGYGDKGFGERVPPGATIYFEVHLIEVLD